jgi:hypothetical protein
MKGSNAAILINDFLSIGNAKIIAVK